MSPDVLFTIGLLLVFAAAVGGGWILGRDYGRQEGYGEGFRDASTQAEEFIVWDFNDREETVL